MRYLFKSNTLFYSLAILLVLTACGNNRNSKSNKQKDKYELFWQWFETKEDEYFVYEKNQAKLFDSLDSKLSAIHPNITFIFSEAKEGKRDFIVSADSAKEAFLDVRELARAAPNLKKWNVIAFRPRLNPLVSIAFKGLIVEPDDIMVKYNYNKENKLIDLELYIKNYKKSDNRYLGASLVMLENALGESDAEMKIGTVELKKFIQQPDNKNLIPLKELPKVVDSYFE
ncbi:MAG: hypothetical protein IPG89_10380 [Bacteroidetes bacterium]|nr:hypothetical protein [Bacteroidota bacterium]